MHRLAAFPVLTCGTPAAERAPHASHSLLPPTYRPAPGLALHGALPLAHARALVALLFTAAITLSLGQGIRLLVDQGFLTASPELLNRYILLFFVLVLGLAVGTFVRFYLVSWIGERFVADIRKRVFDHLIELHPGFYETNRSSEIQSRLTADTTLLQTVIGSSLSMALRNALMLVGGVLLMFVTNAKLTSIVVLALPLVIAPNPAVRPPRAQPVAGKPGPGGRRRQLRR
ncbi:ATP-binding/permease fusion ABC transporter [Pseudomonas aeruginosa]|nr:ATP-binding/permease fusion ABC transporter [Pseudomonas aeruginosa]